MSVWHGLDRRNIFGKWGFNHKMGFFEFFSLKIFYFYFKSEWRIFSDLFWGVRGLCRKLQISDFLIYLFFSCTLATLATSLGCNLYLNNFNRVSNFSDYVSFHIRPCLMENSKIGRVQTTFSKISRFCPSPPLPLYLCMFREFFNFKHWFWKVKGKLIKCGKVETNLRTGWACVVIIQQKFRKFEFFHCAQLKIQIFGIFAGW